MHFTTYDLTHQTKPNRNLDLSLRPCRLPILSANSRRLPCRRQLLIPSPQTPLFRLPAIQNNKIANFLTIGKSVMPSNKLPEIKKIAKLDNFGDTLQKKEFDFHSTPIVIKGYIRNEFEFIRDRIDNINHRSGLIAPVCSLASDFSFSESSNFDMDL